MKRETALAFSLGLLSTMVLPAFPHLASAQDGQSHPGPTAPSHILGSQLIAWSEVQKPQPVTQPLPSSNRPVPQPDHQPAQTANHASRSTDQGAAVPESYVYQSPNQNNPNQNKK
jgi:hypothetical protein